MTKYNRINNVIGWIVFLASTVVYWLTAEPSGSFWDCGEFISCAYKLQVPHSPGAPLFIIIAHLVSQLSPDPAHVALAVNYFSGVMSALTNLFLFWSITALARKIFGKTEGEVSDTETIAIMGAGLVGAFANCFADSFWFSAVEGEVYASSSFFTAIVFWAILKWEQVADKPYADRWILFIGYMIGLAVGVHLLGLLAIPALVFVYYFKKFKVSTWGSVKALAVSIAILGFVQYGIIPQIPNLSAKFDILFVNSFHLPFNSGVLFFFLLIIGLVVFGLMYSKMKAKYVLNTAILTCVFIMIGYSSYMMVLIRSSANPSINMGAPYNAINLLSYLNREQYGDHPLFYGETFAAKPIEYDLDNGEMRYYPDKKTGKYIEMGRKPIIKYAEGDKMLFPRIYDGDDPDHVRFYRNWLGLKENEKPTFGDNISFFFTYQVGYMYWRYFMWNFSGRQDDIQGLSGKEHGFWKTGISFIDSNVLGLPDQSNLPYPENRNKANNKFYLIPFILGILGALYHFKMRQRDAFIVLLFFFFTGLAIVIYLNQTPIQPRERDYAYAGSVYAFCIWVGLGVLWIFNQLVKRTSGRNAAIIATLLAASAPILMGAQGWDDHDRSQRYIARDMGSNYLQSCAPNAILFTQGDNDTYPLWYAQEVEGIRPDVRIVNLSLLGVDWYIDELRRRVNKSDPVIISQDSASYRGSNHDYVRYYENASIAQNQSYSLNSVLDFIFSTDRKKMLPYENEWLNYLPTRNLYIPVDKKLVLANNVVQPSDTSKILDKVEWKLNKGTIVKNDIFTLEILRSNLWKRPVYFAISVASDAYLGLNDYLQQEGLTYRVVPYKTKVSEESMVGGIYGGIEPEIAYDNIMNKWKWGGVDTHELYLEENAMRMVSNLRNNFARLADALIKEGKKDSAIKVLDKCLEVLPERNVPISNFNIGIAKNYFDAGAPDKGKAVMEKCIDLNIDQLKYYASISSEARVGYNEDIYQALATLNYISSLMQRYQQPEMAKKAEDAFMKYQGYYIPQKQ